MLITPKDPFATDPIQLLALCIWREARGESLSAKIGVGWVIYNRCQMAPAQGFKADIMGNILKPWAFSSFMYGDPNASKYPEPGDRSWKDCLTAADTIDSVDKWTHEELIHKIDPTNGAVFYDSFKVPPGTHPPIGAPGWGKTTFTVSIGNLHFFKLG